MEEWRDVVESGGAYQVSNFGNVRSLKRNKISLLKPHSLNGHEKYKYVSLYFDG